MAEKISAKDVLEFFKGAELEIVELIHDIGGKTLSDRLAVRKKQRETMVKARAARKPKGTAAAASNAPNGAEATQGAQVAQVAQPAHRGPGRPPRVQAPPQTAAATSVESDEVIG
jgi:hypothetical protein